MAFNLYPYSVSIGINHLKVISALWSLNIIKCYKNVQLNKTNTHKCLKCNHLILNYKSMPWIYANSHLYSIKVTKRERIPSLAQLILKEKRSIEITQYTSLCRRSRSLMPLTKVMWWEEYVQLAHCLTNCKESHFGANHYTAFIELGQNMYN